MPENASILARVVAESSYRCKNRITKSIIRMTTLKIIIGNRLSFGYDVYCDTHNQACPQVKNKTEAILAVRKPWTFCNECAAIHFNTVWQLDPNVRRGTHTHRCNCFLEDDNE